MKKNMKNGFTLVELLAVIVILAIILVIAVPKVMSVIEDSKKATLESTAKMIASGAEKQKVQNTVLGKTEEITCDSVAKINKGDYANCSITFVDNTAKVTIEGAGKFDNLWVCEGTKTGAVATNEACSYPMLMSGEKFGEFFQNINGETPIIEINFVDTYEPKENETTTDVSNATNNTILAYTNVNSDNEAIITITGNGSGKLALNENTSGMFASMSSLKRINGMEMLDWRKVTNMGRMFLLIDVETINLGNATNLASATFFISSVDTLEITESVTCLGESDLGEHLGEYFNVGNIILNEKNLNYKLLNGILYNKDLTKLIKYSTDNTEERHTVIDSVKLIAAFAFRGAKNLKYLNTNNVVELEHSVFDSSSIEEIDAPNVATVETDAYSSFINARNLKKLIIPKVLDLIGELPFLEQSYMSQNKIESIDVGNNNPNYTTVDGILYNKDMTRLLFYPSYKLGDTFIVPNSVTIMSDVLYSTQYLKNLVISKNIVEIGAYNGLGTITDIYYEGTEEEWNNLITIYDDLDNINMHFESTGPITN